MMSSVRFSFFWIVNGQQPAIQNTFFMHPFSILISFIKLRASGYNLRTIFHDKQLLDRVHSGSSEQFRRSIFGMVGCYNALPAHVVDAPSVKIFQKSLQNAVIRRVTEGHDGWQDVFTEGRRYASVRRFQAFFV